MGLGHVINIKHMVFSRVRFNSRQRVHERETDVGGQGECLGSVPKRRRNKQPMKKKQKAEPGGCCSQPGREGAGFFIPVRFGEDWEAVL